MFRRILPAATVLLSLGFAPAPIYREARIDPRDFVEPVCKNPEMGSEPVADLYAPTADVDNKGALVMSWNVKSTTAGATVATVYLVWAREKSGPWRLITRQEDAEGDGKYSWLLPPGTPKKVYLRLIAVDSGRRKAVATTSEAHQLPEPH